jgi:hypothetical protein
LSEAATATGTTMPGFLARSGLAAAEDLDKSASLIAGRREVVAELFAARRHLGHVGNNLNQVARILNAGGNPTGVATVISAVGHAVLRVQQATDRLLSSETSRPLA